jgi:Uri superfamily endonuclease
MPLKMGVPLLEELPAQKGVYILFLQLAESKTIEVGKYGSCDFPTGVYAYVGSAHGKGGIAARLKHHLWDPQKPHWHIDWVRPLMEWVGLFYETNPLSNECTWSKRLSVYSGSQVIIPGFGASDCQQGCPTHFYTFPQKDFDPDTFIQQNVG